MTHFKTSLLGTTAVVLALGLTPALGQDKGAPSAGASGGAGVQGGGDTGGPSAGGSGGASMRGGADTGGGPSAGGSGRAGAQGGPSAGASGRAGAGADVETRGRAGVEDGGRRGDRDRASDSDRDRNRDRASDSDRDRNRDRAQDSNRERNRDRAGDRDRNPDRDRADRDRNQDRDRANRDGDDRNVGRALNDPDRQARAKQAREQFSSQHKEKVRTYFRDHDVRHDHVDDIDFSISIGTFVPGYVTFYPLPATIFVGLPSDYEYVYFVHGDDIIVCDAYTHVIVEVIHNVV